MDLRARALTGAAAAWVAIGLGGCGTAGTAIGTLEVDAVEERVDAEALVAIEALLLDPVDLASRDRERLAELPWIGAAEIAAFEGVTPPVDTRALAELPGWDATLARRTAPFVRFASRPVSGTERVVALEAIPTAGRMRLRFGGLEAMLRAPLECPECVAGALRARRGGLSLQVGDLRASAGQGLLAWGSEARARALSGWRNARGLAGTTSASGARTVRGIGLAWEGAQSAWIGLTGRTDSGAAHLALATWRVHPALELDVGAAHIAGRSAAALGLVAGKASARLAAQVVLSGGRWAWTLATESRPVPRRVGARLALAPEGFDWPLGAFAGDGGSARAAEIWFADAWRGVGGELGGLCAWERMPGSAARTRNEAWIEIFTRAATMDWTFRWTERAELQESFADPTMLQRERDRQALRLVRAARVLGADWIATFEARDGRLERPSATGDALRNGRLVAARLERRAGRLRPGLALASHVVEPGLSLASPTVESTVRTTTLSGDGTYWAAGLAWRSGCSTVRGSVAARHPAAGAVRTAWRWSAEFRWPPVRVVAER